VILGMSAYCRDSRFYHAADRLFDVNDARFEPSALAELLGFKVFENY